MRIAMFSIHSSPLGPLGSRNTGGMSVYIRELARMLGERGHHIDIYTCAHGRAVEVKLHQTVRLVHLEQSGDTPLAENQLARHLNTIFHKLEAHRKTKGRNYDLVHSHYWLSGVLGVMAQARWRRPHVTMFHTLGVLKNKTAARENASDLRIAHEHWIAKVADRVIVPTPKEHRNLLLHYHAPADRVVTIPCGVDLDRFRPLNRKATRLALGIPPQADVVLYVGRFAPLKGIDQLIQAVADLIPVFPELHLLVVGGDGPDAASNRDLSQLAHKLGINSRVTFAGRVEQQGLPLYYSAADLLALPSHYESFGLVVLESLACGTPVAATPVGVVDTLINPGLNGEIIATPHHGHVADAIARLLSRPFGRRLRGEAVRHTVNAYDWGRVAGRMADTYAQLLDTHDPERAPWFNKSKRVMPK